MLFLQNKEEKWRKSARTPEQSEAPFDHYQKAILFLVHFPARCQHQACRDDQLCKYLKQLYYENAIQTLGVTEYQAFAKSQTHTTDFTAFYSARVLFTTRLSDNVSFFLLGSFNYLHCETNQTANESQESISLSFRFNKWTNTCESALVINK